MSAQANRMVTENCHCNHVAANIRLRMYLMPKCGSQLYLEELCSIESLNMAKSSVA